MSEIDFENFSLQSMREGINFLKMKNFPDSDPLSKKVISLFTIYEELTLFVTKQRQNPA